MKREIKTIPLLGLLGRSESSRRRAVAHPAVRGDQERDHGHPGGHGLRRGIAGACRGRHVRGRRDHQLAVVSTRLVQPHNGDDASITYTHLLNRADIRRWWTPGAGIGFRFTPHAGLRVGYTGDFASGYTSNGGNVQVYFTY